MIKSKIYSRGFLSAAFLFFSINIVFAQGVRPFRQQVDYKIQVRLDDNRHTLRGDVEFVYHNNSSDFLDTLWIQLWPNAYSNSKTALAEQLTDKRNEKLKLRPNKFGGSIDSLLFTVNGSKIDWNFHPEHRDVAYIILDKPLAPDSACTVKTPFLTYIPEGTVSRFGHNGRDYYITNWYPMPAVYDATGWHPMPFKDQGSLYAEFGSFDVEITLPSSYVVASTGILKTQSELDFLQKKVEEVKSYRDDGPAPEKSTDRSLKTIRYTAENVRNFAFFADEDFWVEKDTLLMPSGRNVSMYAFYNPKYQSLWTNGMRYMNNAISFFSKHVGEYPYDQYNVVDGIKYAGADHTYSMLSVIGYKKSRLDLEDIIVTTASNTWFTGIVGPDESRSPWMGEGLNAYYMRRYLRETKPAYNGLPIPVLPVLGLRFVRRYTLDHIPYLYKVRRGSDQAPGLPADQYSAGNGSYGIAVRGQNAMLYYYLEQYLGTAKFDSVIQNYYRDYTFLKPTPADFRKSIELQTGKNLSWFFDDLLYQDGHLDYSIKHVGKYTNPETDKEEIGIVVENLGTVGGPFPMTVYLDEKVGGSTTWHEGFTGEQIIFLPVKKNRTVQIDKNEVVPEVNRKNNTYKTGSRFPKSEKVAFNFIIGPPEYASRRQVFFSPFPLWNNYNKTMLGIVVHNKTPIRKKFEYLVAPMVSQNPVGFAFVGSISGMFPMKKSKVVESIAYKLGYTRFAYIFDTQARDWDRILTKFMVNLRPPSPRSERRSQVYIRNIFNILEATDAYRMAFGKNHLAYNVNELGFSMRDNRLLNPYQLLVTLEYIQELNTFSKPGLFPGTAGKLSMEFRQKISYLSANKGLDIRIFGGTFLGNSKTILDYRYRMSGHPGYWDYKYDNYYLGRSETKGLSSRQFFEYDGGFKVLTPLGQTNRWLTAINLKASLPGPIPIKPFFDMAVYRQVTTMANTGEQVKSINFSYSGGVMVSVINDVLEVYFPIYHSKDIRDYLKLNDIKWYNQIRFRMNIAELNPRRIREKIEWLPR
jgi:hypothetical protein